MELVRNLRWICRVCGVDMKEKGTEQASVYIFGSAQVNQKLKKYFDIDVSQADILPKYICRQCFKKLENAHEFARVAKKTDRFLKTFTNSAYVNSSHQISPSDFASRFQTEFASFALSLENDNLCKTKIRRAEQKRVSLLKRPQPGNLINTTKSVPFNRTTNIQQPVYNNLEEKRQNLKTALATSKAASQSLPRIKVKSDIALKSPQPNMNCFSSQQPMKVISIPQVSTIPTNVPNTMYDERLKLGQVVKDIDLLTLILKALKWPYTNDNILVQIDRLKETPFRQVIGNHNLLQDTDLMQILNTILSPILLQRPIVPQPAPQTIPTFVSYKIPADLSVRLITEEVQDAPFAVKQKQNNSLTLKSKSRTPKVKPYQKPVLRCSTPIEILSDDDSVQMFEVNVDPNLYLNLDSESLENSSSSEAARKEQRNEDLLMFKIQKKHRKKVTNSKRKTQPVDDVPPKKVELIIPDVLTENCLDAICEKSSEIQSTGESSHTCIVETQEKTIVEDISGDDDAWSEFKVIDSPNTSVEHEKATSNYDVDSIRVKIEAGQKITSYMETSKTENHDENPKDKHVTDVKVEFAENATPRQTGDETTTDVNNHLFENESSLCEEMSPLKVEISPDKGKSYSRRRGRQKSTAPQDASNEMTSEKEEPVDNSNTTNTTTPKRSGRKVKYVTSPENTTKRATRSTTPATQTSMSLRNSNLRRRICKQCGQSFTLLTEFLDHRKKHIET